MSSPFVVISNADIVWRNNQPYSETFQDIYFSADEGFAEKDYVFIQGNQLIGRWQAMQASQSVQFVVAETGFGTGLNFLIAWHFWREHAPSSAHLYYYSAESHPLSKSDLQQCLQLWPQLAPLAAQLLEKYPILTPGFHSITFKEGNVTLILMLGDVCQTYQQLLVSGDNSLEREIRTFWVDAWFLDGFAPQKNTTIWSEEFFQIMGLLSNANTTASTYTVAGVVRKNLANNGFSVERVQGFGSKKQMLTARFEQSPAMHHWRYCQYRLTPWHIAPQSHPQITRKVIIIGAGLAGCFTAFFLAQRGWEVTLLEAKNNVGEGASGNISSVLYPKLSAFRSPLTELMLMAFLHAVRCYQPLLDHEIEGELKGILQFATSARDLASQENLRSWLTAYPELGCLVDKAQASELAGIPLREGGLFIPDSGWINSQSLCEYLIKHPLITVKTNMIVERLIFGEGVWHAANETASVLIIANGNAASQFEQCQWLPIKSVAGQMTYVKSTAQSQLVKIPLCGKGHFLPARFSKHAIGATYHLKQNQFSKNKQDDALNLARLQELPIDWDFNPEIVESWGGVRAAAPDYLPFVGPVAKAEDFNTTYNALAKDSRRFIPALAAHYPNLYVCAGFGSRGLTTIPLCAEWLAAHINQEPSVLPRSMVQAISPARFLRQGIIAFLPLA